MYTYCIQWVFILCRILDACTICTRLVVKYDSGVSAESNMRVYFVLSGYLYMIRTSVLSLRCRNILYSVGIYIWFAIAESYRRVHSVLSGYLYMIRTSVLSLRCRNILYSVGIYIWFAIAESYRRVHSVLSGYLQLLSKIFIDSDFCHNYLHTLYSRIGEQQRFRRACAYAQSRQILSFLQYR